MKNPPESPSLLGVNELPYTPSDAVLSSIDEAAGEANRYPEGSALPLRTAIARHHEVDVNWVVAGNGSNTVIQQIMIASGQREVVFGWPSFDGFAEIAVGLNMKTATVPLRDHQCKLEDLKNAITADTSLVIICNPHPPTGSVTPFADIRRFIASIPSTVTVLIDEAYVEFIDGINDPLTALELVKTYPNVVMSRTFSKAYGLAGLRVGYCIAQPVLAQKIARVGVSFAVSRPAQAAAIQALQQPAIMQARTQKIITERTYLAAQIKACGTPVVVGHGNFVWLPLGKQTAFVVDALQKYNIFVKMLMPFGVRIAVGTRRDTTAFIEAWAHIWPKVKEEGMEFNQTLKEELGAVVSAVEPDPKFGPQDQRLITTISNANVGNTRISTGLVYMPPKHSARAHVHKKYEIIVFILEGWVASLMGPDLKPIIHKPGDFIFIPAGVEHVGANISSEQRAIVLESRADPDFNEDVEVLPHLDKKAAETLQDIREKYRGGMFGKEYGPGVHGSFNFPEARMTI